MLFDGFSNLCLANAVEPLRAANSLSRRRLYDWGYYSQRGEVLLSSSALPVHPKALSADTGGAALLVMPSYGYETLDTPELRRSLRAAAGRFDVLAGLDTGAWLLASAGLLDGHRATAHWDVLGDLAEAFPTIDVVDTRWVIDGNRASCGGATTTLELLLEMIERHHGATLALEVSSLFMFGERDPQMNPLRRWPEDQLLRAAAALMRRHIEAPLPIPALAQRIGISARRLEQIARAETGQTPAQIYRKIRLAEARRRLEQTQASVTEVALRCGYHDPTALTRAFRAEFGVTPRQVRQMINAT
ncbi:GlxA family transcriptional regulator [Thalassovita mediterranea]|jgi:transcriptional regulator GlxA family with amidase domain|uniref:Carnitine catabolism transcriptional activator n=1 Tax=Thalassovita mediterranea TaxID=340021 RepID=A0A0P1GTD2_9RHOB|nr:helix-turn-helix domain-containing protein [Thalassovita mediterranea]CUH85921.1 Carnitine catabolism transcriptional activator [Thalassovita mediterranea]SIS32820.1 transcriptional regulator, AraC family with amidase-like domain [Thalassovita mediterranea]